MSALHSAALGLLVLASATPVSADVHYGIRDGGAGAWSNGRFELGPRVTHLLLRDAEDEGSTLPMGGAGLYVRYRITRRWGMEGTLDVLASDELSKSAPGDVVRITAPLTLSAMFYLFPDSKFQMYLLCGVGVAEHEIDYEALGQRVRYTTPIGQAGIGAQYRLESIRFDLSLRSLSFERDAKDIEVVDTGPPRGSVAYQPKRGDRHVQGAMLNLGVHWGW